MCVFLLVNIFKVGRHVRIYNIKLNIMLQYIHTPQSISEQWFQECFCSHCAIHDFCGRSGIDQPQMKLLKR